MLNRHTGSQHGKNKKIAPVPPQSKDVSVDQPCFKSIGTILSPNGNPINIWSGNLKGEAALRLYEMKKALTA